MYKVWFEGFVDRYYKGYENAREACVRFIKMTERDADAQNKLLGEFDMFDETAICGVKELEFMDEIPVFQPQKREYAVIFKKTEIVEVEAFNEDEAEELAMVILENDTDAWTDHYSEIIVEEI